MLSRGELTTWATQLGVAEGQVRRDHLLSHLLQSLATHAEDLLFFGGTALARTYLWETRWSRLSEDLDLLALGQRDATASELDEFLPRALRREFPNLTWEPALQRTPPPAPARLTDGRSSVRIQLLPGRGAWSALAKLPSHRRAVFLRYPDTIGQVELRVPTLPAFASMKLSSWEERGEPRDLFDLAGLAEIGAVDQHALALFRQLWGREPTRLCYERLPEHVERRWESELGHQLSTPPDAPTSLRIVRQALEQAG